MSTDGKNKKHHRGRRKKKAKNSLVTNILLAVAVVVFCISAFQLFKIAKGYLDGRGEYKKIADLALKDTDDKDKFRVDFDELLKVNPDTIGWLRFHPEPSIINYPVVQGEDNQEYLHKTFSANENTMGTIFLNVDNSKDFSDKNSIVYGHRMKDGSMFRHLWDYDDQEFYSKNPYFYIYTPDGREITYHIFAAAKVGDTSEAYTTVFGSEAQFEEVVKEMKEASFYNTNVEVGGDDSIVTLSTCTAESDDNRMIVCGVKEKEVKLEE